MINDRVKFYAQANFRPNEKNRIYLANQNVISCSSAQAPAAAPSLNNKAFAELLWRTWKVCLLKFRHLSIRPKILPPQNMLRPPQMATIERFTVAIVVDMVSYLLQIIKCWNKIYRHWNHNMRVNYIHLDIQNQV